MTDERRDFLLKMLNGALDRFRAQHNRTPTPQELETVLRLGVCHSEVEKTDSHFLPRYSWRKTIEVGRKGTELRVYTLECECNRTEALIDGDPLEYEGELTDAALWRLLRQMAAEYYASLPSPRVMMTTRWEYMLN
jgi:hypothetical protein